MAVRQRTRRREPISLARQRAGRVAPVAQFRIDAAQTTDENRRHWANADGLGPKTALDPAVRRTLRNRARYEVLNDPYANGIISTLANDCIGTGPRLQMATGDKAADSFVELEFWRWSQAISLPRKLRTMRRAKAVDGEAFASMFQNLKLRTRVRLDLQLHEAEMVASPLWSADAGSLSDGIVFDDFGNVAAYMLLPEHPGESGGDAFGGKPETVPAQFMIHLFNADRPGQVRGCTELCPALPFFAMRRRYTLAVLRTAENQANTSGVIKTASPATDPAALQPLDVIDLERGSYTVMPEGWDLQSLLATQPTSTYDGFQRALIREIARCFNMPFNVAAGDSSGYNYSSGRMDHQVYFKSISVERSAIEADALDPLFAMWWREARLLSGYLPESIRSVADPGHEWQWDGREHVDPLKEATAQKERLASHTTTLADEYAKQGQDWEDKLRQRAKELALMSELGMSPAAAPPASTNSAVDQEDANGD